MSYNGAKIKESPVFKSQRRQAMLYMMSYKKSQACSAQLDRGFNKKQSYSV